MLLRCSLFITFCPIYWPFGAREAQINPFITHTAWNSLLLWLLLVEQKGRWLKEMIFHRETGVACCHINLLLSKNAQIWILLGLLKLASILIVPVILLLARANVQFIKCINMWVFDYCCCRYWWKEFDYFLSNFHYLYTNVILFLRILLLIHLKDKYAFQKIFVNAYLPLHFFPTL